MQCPSRSAWPAIRPAGLWLAIALTTCPTAGAAGQVADTAAHHPHVIRWYEAAAAVGGIGLLSALDEPTRRFVQDHRSSTGDDVADVFRQEGEPIYYGGLSIGLLAAGLATQNKGMQRTGKRLIASLALSEVANTSIKLVLSRSRPNEGVGAFEFHPFSSRKDSAGVETRRSLPSGHTTAAFAVATTLADAIHSPVADVVLYTLATGTAWSRLNDDRHWLSDTALGAFLGITAAKLVDGHWRVFHIRPPSILVSATGAPTLGWDIAF